MFKQNPTSLIIVAFIFLVIGLYGLFEQIKTFYNEGFNLGLGWLLAILVFWGLLKHRKGWRTLALVFIWIEMLQPLFRVGDFILGRRDLRLFGNSSLEMSFPLILVPAVAISLLGFWQYKVLTSKKIKAMFFPEKEESA